MNVMEYLKQITSEYDKIFILECNDDTFINYLNMRDDTKKNVLITSNEIKYFSNKFDVKHVIKEEATEIIKLYHTYEFSDKVQLITHNKNMPYADLLNYIDTGLMTIEEAAEAVLI